MVTRRTANDNFTYVLNFVNSDTIVPLQRTVGSLEAHEQRKIKKKQESFDDHVLQTNVTVEEEAMYVQRNEQGRERNYGRHGFGRGRGGRRGYDHGTEIHSYDCYNCGKPVHYARNCMFPKMVKDGANDCYNCGKSGHYAKDCKLPKKVEENTNLVIEEDKVYGIFMIAYEEVVEEEALMVYEDVVAIDTQWYLDTAARNHMCGNKGSNSPSNQIDGDMDVDANIKVNKENEDDDLLESEKVKEALAQDFMMADLGLNQGSARTTSVVDLEEFCEKHYEKLLPIMADKYEYEKKKKEKLEEVKARLNFGDNQKKSTMAQESTYSESRTISPRRQRRSRSPRHNPSIFTRLRHERSRSPRREYKSKERRESTVFKRLEGRGRSTSVHSDSRQESSSVEDDDLSQPWVCAETDSFTSRIRHFDFLKTRMPSHVKTYNGSEDPEDHLKIFQAAAKTERWAMPTWCHMFNSTLTGNARVWFDDLPPESIDSYNDLREAFLKNYLQQKKCIRDPIVLHNIKQRDGESTEDFIQRYKSESGNVKGAPECMRISGFVHGITNPELIKRFHEKIPKTVDEMMQVATSFLQGQEAASNQERKKVPQAWRHPEGNHRQNFKKGGGFRSQHKAEKRPDRFALLTKTPKEILALEKGKFKTPPPMTTPVEKRNANKFCEFHGEVGHNTDECNHLRKQIEDMLKAGKLSHIIRELKQNSGKEQPKKKGETSGKEKPQAILMIQSRQNAVRQKITQSFSPDLEISFPPLGNDEGAEGPLIIEAEVGGHQVHRMCIDGGSSFEILYEHCFNRLRPEIRNQMVPATTSLVGFSGEIKWPLGQITLV
ncbi:reverse transcriptase domain-containing protein [Tanacetum coccineum]